MNNKETNSTVLVLVIFVSIYEMYEELTHKRKASFNMKYKQFDKRWQGDKSSM